jgi:hypothetical protein
VSMLFQLLRLVLILITTPILAALIRDKPELPAGGARIPAGSLPWYADNARGFHGRARLEEVEPGSA